MLMSENEWHPRKHQQDLERQHHQPRTAGLLSRYAAKQSEATNDPVSQGPSSWSPLPDASHQDTQEVPARGQSSPKPRSQSGQPPVDLHSLIHAPHPQLPQVSDDRPVSWRRSRVQRVTYLRKKRLERWQGPGRSRLSSVLLVVLAAFLLIVLTSAGSYGSTFYQSELPQVEHLANLQTPQSTRIYDRHGVLLDTLYQNTRWGEGGRSIPVSYRYLPGVLQDAQIAAEDPTFWTNEGIDPVGMLRALQQYLAHSGKVVGGGSTITQQLIKNLSHHTQITWQRKASEIALAMGLTQQYPKWKILEMYFNVTPYGAQEKGVEAAVEDYFGLQPQCDRNHRCLPAVAFLDRDLSRCRTPADYRTCASDPILALTRAALLAGIPQDPTTFDPSVSVRNTQNVLTNRLPYVLEQMRADHMQINLGLGSHTNKMGRITDAMIRQVEVRATHLTIVGFHQRMLAPHFVQWVITTLANALGHDQNLDLHGISIPGYQTLLTSGLNIYTTLDLNLEQFVEKDIAHNLRDPVCEPYTGCGPLDDAALNVHDSAAVVMDAKTGEILAMDGSADYTDTSNPEIAGQVNAATAYRQPGSSIKPIVYAAAFEKGWYPGIKLLDGKTYFPNGGNPRDPAEGSTYTPTDYRGSYHPQLPTDLRISIANSFNIPAIKTLMYAGFDDVVTMAKRLGITALDRDLAAYNAAHPGGHETLDQLFGPSLALGTADIPLYQMVGAYQAFANNGRRVPRQNILAIYDNYGHALYQYNAAHPQSTQVISPQIAFLINSMLSDNAARRYEFQGIHTLTMDDEPGNLPVAAKTGTSDSFVDNWTVGYTTSVVVGVWSGNANGQPMGNDVIGVSGAGPIWHDIIEYATGFSKLGMTPDLPYPASPFPRPAGLIQAPVNPINGLQGTGVTDWLLASEQPQQSGLPACDPNAPSTPTCPAGTGDGSLNASDSQGQGGFFGNDNLFGNGGGT